MSAFIVNPKHIDALVSAMLDGHMSYWDGHNRVFVTRHNAEETGRILLEENLRSVNYRYGGRIGDDKKSAAASYRFTPFRQTSLARSIDQSGSLLGLSIMRDRRLGKFDCVAHLSGDSLHR
jgi:hypothetical protein